MFRILCAQCGAFFHPPGNICFCSTECEAEYRLIHPRAWYDHLVVLKLREYIKEETKEERKNIARVKRCIQNKDLRKRL